MKPAIWDRGEILDRWDRWDHEVLQVRLVPVRQVRREPQVIQEKQATREKRERQVKQELLDTQEPLERRDTRDLVVSMEWVEDSYCI